METFPEYDTVYGYGGQPYIHLGVEQACHDNLKSLAYMLMYFLCSALSWQGLKAATKKQKYNHIMEKKATTPTNMLCHGFPNEFGVFLNYTCALHFNNKPDYSYLCKLFCCLFICAGYQYDYTFDWSVQRAQDDKTAEEFAKVRIIRFVVEVECTSV